MARTVITKTTPSTNGVAITTLTAVDAAASPNGMAYVSDGTELVIIRNGDASTHTMTVDIPGLVDGQTVTDKTVTIPAGGTYIAGPYGPQYRQSNGQVYLNFDAATSMSVGVINV